jgi:hypothetical protein
MDRKGLEHLSSLTDLTFLNLLSDTKLARASSTAGGMTAMHIAMGRGLPA